MRMLPLALVVAACSPQLVTPPKAVTFAKDVRPFFVAKCIACHFAGAPTHLDLVDPFNETEGVIDRETSWRGPLRKQVVPGSPDESFLLAKIDGRALDVATEGTPMPLNYAMPTTEEVEAVRQWIAAGAKND